MVSRESITEFTFVSHLEHGYEEHAQIGASVLRQHATPLVEDVRIQSIMIIQRMPATGPRTPRLLSVVQSTSLAGKESVRKVRSVSVRWRARVTVLQG